MAADTTSPSLQDFLTWRLHRLAKLTDRQSIDAYANIVGLGVAALGCRRGRVAARWRHGFYLHLFSIQRLWPVRKMHIAFVIDPFIYLRQHRVM